MSPFENLFIRALKKSGICRGSKLVKIASGGLIFALSAAILEKYVPNFHRTGDVHDAWVDALILYGVPDLIANIPTMVPAFIYALGLNLYEDGSLALEYIVDTGTDVYKWTKEIIGNYLIDPLSNLIGDFLNNVSSTFSSVYNLITPNGRPE